MDAESAVNLPNPVCLVKVLFGLALLAIIVFAANGLPISSLSLIQKRVVFVVLRLLSLAIIPVVRLVYFRMYELQRTFIVVKLWKINF